MSPAAPEASPAAALPLHARVYLEEGAVQRSGTRCWLAMEGGQIQRTFGGPGARQDARAWVAEKFGALPYDEFEIPMEE